MLKTCSHSQAESYSELGNTDKSRGSKAPGRRSMSSRISNEGEQKEEEVEPEKIRVELGMVKISASRNHRDGGSSHLRSGDSFTVEVWLRGSDGSPRTHDSKVILGKAYRQHLLLLFCHAGGVSFHAAVVSAPAAACECRCYCCCCC